MKRATTAPEDQRLRSVSAKLPAELGEEARVGDTPTGAAINAALLALSRAARGFLVYEPDDATIRHLVEDLRVKAKRALDSAQALDLEVRPHELVQAGEVVYREADPERSLALRLFRDGVRRLRVAREARWEEIQRLLEILSVRYTGVGQTEDDVVTLLRKADLTHVGIDVVEGSALAGGEAEPPQPGSGEASRPAAPEVPADWDLPARELSPPVEIEWRSVPDEDVAALAAEEAADAFPANTVLAVKALLDLHGELPATPSALDGFMPFITEARDFLLSEGHLKEMVLLVRALYDGMRASPQACAPILRTFAEREALRGMILGVAPGALSPPPEMLELLDLIPADHLATVIGLLGEDVDEQARRIMRQVVERYAPAHPDLLLSRLRESPPRVACDLLRACARALPERAVEAAMELASHPDADVVHEALRRFEKAPANPRITRLLTQLLGHAQEDVRLRALDLLSRRNERTAFGAVAEHAERRAVSELTVREAELVGRTLARLSPDSVLGLFDGWLRPKGLVGRWADAAGARMIQWVIVSGLGSVPGAEADALLRQVADKSEGDLKRHALAALERRKHKDDGDG